MSWRPHDQPTINAPLHDGHVVFFLLYRWDTKYAHRVCVLMYDFFFMWGNILRPGKTDWKNHTRDTHTHIYIISCPPYEVIAPLWREGKQGKTGRIFLNNIHHITSSSKHHCHLFLIFRMRSRTKNSPPNLRTDIYLTTWHGVLFSSFFVFLFFPRCLP